MLKLVVSRSQIFVKYSAFNQTSMLDTQLTLNTDSHSSEYISLDKFDSFQLKTKVEKFICYTQSLIEEIDHSGIDPKPKLLEYLANKTGDYFGMIEVFKD